MFKNSLTTAIQEFLVKLTTKWTLLKKLVKITIEIALVLREGERHEKTRQMELQLPELSYVIVPSFLFFFVCDMKNGSLTLD